MEVTENYIIIDNFFPQEIIDGIIEECANIEQYAVKNNVSRDGRDLTNFNNSRSMFLDIMFQDRTKSWILTAFDNLFVSLIQSVIDGDIPNVFKILKYTSHDSTEFQIYPNKGFYSKHEDDMRHGELIVCNLLVCKEPKRFTGGELVIGKDVIEHKNNRLVIFPGFLEHEVKEVKLESPSIMDSRISLQHRSWFLGGQPSSLLSEVT